MRGVEKYNGVIFLQNDEKIKLAIQHVLFFVCKKVTVSFQLKRDIHIHFPM